MIFSPLFCSLLRCRLSGVAAIKSKNVCLQLVDNHTSLTNSGVVQLFTQPHPQKIVPSPYWSKVAPRLRNLIPKISKIDRATERVSDDEGHSSGFEEVESPVTMLNVARSSPLALSRLLSRSRGSLLAGEEISRIEKLTSQIIQLPKDYNPIAALIQTETTHSFMNKVSNHVYQPEIMNDSELSCYRQIVACARIKEQQILGCLIVEIFLHTKFRTTWNTGRISFARRIETCINTLKQFPDALPKCVRNAVSLLLQIDMIPKSYGINTESCDVINDGPFRYPTVTHMGLPPPSAHQFLQPILSNSLFPSSRYFQYLFNIVEMLEEYNNLVRELNSVLCDEDTNETASTTKIQFLCKMSECKVKAVARELERMLPHACNIMESSSLQLIVPHVKQMMEEPFSAVLAAWFLFEPIAKALGPKDTAETFLTPILKLYEQGSIMDNANNTEHLPAAMLPKFRTMRLYHRTFLLKLIVRLGLRRFLDNFITPLVEAVGCYRDYPHDSSNNINYHRTGNLKSCDLTGSCCDGDIILSPLDEDSSVDSEQNINLGTVSYDSERIHDTSTIEDNVEEVFAMESDEILSPLEVKKPSNNTNMVLNLTVVNDIVNDVVVRDSPPGIIKSPTITIPKPIDTRGTKSVTEFNTIGCHVGSKTSYEDFFLSNSYTDNVLLSHNSTSEMSLSTPESDHSKPTLNIENNTTSNDETNDELKIRNDEMQCLSAPNESKVSDMSTESVIWLSHRLGPVLTARYLSRNLLRMLTLCYAGKINLTSFDHNHWSNGSLYWKKMRLIGDVNATKVLESLTAIANLYGEQMVLFQYFGHMAELLALCKRKLTPNLEGGLVSCFALLSHITPCLSDATLIDSLHETIVKAILQPTIRILATTRYSFPNGAIARMALADKYIEVLSQLCLRIGSATTKSHLSVPIQRFFLIFDKVFGEFDDPIHIGKNQQRKNEDIQAMNVPLLDEKCTNESRNWTEVDSTPLTMSKNQATSEIVSNVAISYSPPALDNDTMNSQRNHAFEELKTVFTMEFAHKTYLLFYRNLDDGIMEEILKNHQFIHSLCEKYESTILSNDSVNINRSDTCDTLTDVKIPDIDVITKGIGSFGNISLIGNRIEVADNIVENTNTSGRDLTAITMGRQLRGNWLAYWEHEIGRPDKDSTFNMKQIKLQSFIGHTNTVKCLHVLDNENSFMSGARDKTVKLWSIRSQGDGNTISSCQYTYTGHKKSILALKFLESLRYAITCDSTVHCWDPFMGSLLGCPESSRPAPVNTLATNSTLSTALLVATTDITLRVIDCRTFQYVNEMKVSMNPTGLIRCIAIAPNGHWVALGQASGFLTILDIRTGLIIASWKGHECEILQLEAVNDTTIISSSLDQTIAVWSAIDGKLKFLLKGATEPVHCMTIYEHQVVSGTTANKIGVHTSIDVNALFSSSKLRSDAFKGVLTAMTLLPLNRLLLLGADNGLINLLC